MTALRSSDLRQIIDAYLGPHGRLLDITDEPALFYYFLGRDPSSRWYAPNGIRRPPLSCSATCSPSYAEHRRS